MLQCPAGGGTVAGGGMKKFQQSPWSIGTQNFEVEFAIFLEHLREYERFYQLEEAQNAFLDACLRRAYYQRHGVRLRSEM